VSSLETRKPEMMLTLLGKLILVLALDAWPSTGALPQAQSPDDPQVSQLLTSAEAWRQAVIAFDRQILLEFEWPEGRASLAPILASPKSAGRGSLSLRRRFLSGVSSAEVYRPSLPPNDHFLVCWFTGSEARARWLGLGSPLALDADMGYSCEWFVWDAAAKHWRVDYSFLRPGEGSIGEGAAPSNKRLQLTSGAWQGRSAARS
jgi:hypothetical protein